LNQQVTKSSLSVAQIRLVDLFQEQPFCRIEALQVRGGEPQFTPPPRIIQKLRMGGNNGPRSESGLTDFWLKKQTIELLDTITQLGEGEIRSIEIQHGLPFTVEIERTSIFDGGGEDE
jgi:hypothetical protein